MANGNFGQCSGCGARVIWIKTEAGKNMPCNPTLHNYKIDQTGKEKIVTQTGKVVTGVTGVDAQGRTDLATYHTLQHARVQIISGGVESNGCRYFQHRQEIPDHICRPSVVGNRWRKDKERSRPPLPADENTGDHRSARSGVNSPGRVPPLPVGYEQPPERCLCSYGGLGLPVCNDNYLAERQGWAGTVLPGNDRTLFVRNHQKETAV